MMNAQLTMDILYNEDIGDVFLQPVTQILLVVPMKSDDSHNFKHITICSTKPYHDCRLQCS